MVSRPVQIFELSSNIYRFIRGLPGGIPLLGFDLFSGDCQKCLLTGHSDFLSFLPSPSPDFLRPLETARAPIGLRSAHLLH